VPQDYDPREFGARCDSCYLQDHRDGDPVPPEIHEGAKILAVSDYPGEDEVRKGRPLCGKAGQEFDRGLVSLGLNRRDLSYTNALICRAPENNLAALTAAWQAENKGRLARKEKPLPSVWACCQPRLLNEIRALAEVEGDAKTPVLNVIALGKHAAQATTGRVGSIIDLRGAPQNVIVTEGGSFYSYVEEEEAAREAERYKDGVRLRLVPTVNPAFVLRQRRWTKAFRADLGRAKRWFQGEMRWVEPVFVRNPSLGEFHAFVERFNEDYPPSIDIETRKEYDTDTFFDCLTDVIRTIAISDDEEGIVIHLESIDRDQKYYSDDDLLELIEKGLKPFLETDAFPKILHNGISYDKPVIAAQLGISLNRITDTLIQHKAVESELPHKLAYVASVYTDAPSWKKGDSGEDTAKDATNDEDLGVRNVRDTAITRRVWPVLERIVATRDQQEVVRKDHSVMDLCAGMHRNGLWVDQDVRRWHDLRLLKKAQLHLARIRALLANHDGWSAKDAKDFNPGSSHQLRALLFDRWRMSPPASVSKNKRLTKSNLPSVGDSVLLALRSDGFLSNHQLAIVENLRRYKNAIKERGTYVLKAAPKTAKYALDGLAWEDSDRDEEDFDEEEADEFMASMAEKGAKRQGRVLADERIHPNYSLGANTGRIASSGWNALNVTQQLRDLIKPRPGNVFIYADMDQIQLRIVAWFAQATMYLDVLNSGGDPHAITSAAVFGKRFSDLEAHTPEWDSMRTFSKCVVGSTRVWAEGCGWTRIVDLQPGPMAPDTFAPLDDVFVRNAAGKLVKAAAFYSGGKQAVFRVKTKRGHELCGTASHRLMLADGTWCRLDALKAGMSLKLPEARPLAGADVYAEVPINPWIVKASPRALTPLDGARAVAHHGDLLPQLKVTPEIGWLLGAITGDGCVTHSGVTLTGVRADGVLDAAAGIALRLGLPSRWASKKRPGKSTARAEVVLFGSVALVDLLVRLGMSRPRRRGMNATRGRPKYEQDARKVLRVPDIIFHSPASVVAAFIAGLFDTDGTVATGGWNFTTKSEALAQDVQLLLLQFGIQGHTAGRWNTKYKKFYYTLSLTRPNSMKFSRTIAPYMRCRRKVAAAENVLAKSREAAAAVEDLVVSVEAAGEEPVYDLTVPDGESFLANGLVNHNSFSYASFFGATLETKLGVIRSTEDADGNLVYANLTERELRKRDEAFFAKIPLPAWWESELAAYRKQGYLRDPVWGRRRDFLDGEDVNQIYCFRTQAAESAIVHDAEQEILNFIPFGRWGHGTGIVHEGYDSLMLEVPEDQADYAKGVVEHAMNRDVDGFGVKFTASAKIIKAWYEPACGPCSKKKDAKGKGKKVKLTWTGSGYKCKECGYTE
jgi:DNA polymerase I-like protein with 3'-5' exonuclease and polymerase domains/uracil-DNA glycosylase